MIQYTKTKFRTSTASILLAGVCAFSFLSACGEHCELGTAKCKNNQIYTCEGSASHRDAYWVQFRNCDDFNAECQEGIFTEYLEYNSFDPSQYPDSSEASCVTESYDCQQNTGYFCTEENDVIINCALPKNEAEPVAAISAENWQNKPNCITNSEGTLFAYENEPCAEEGLQKCDEKGRTLVCVFQSWQWFSSYCE